MRRWSAFALLCLVESLSWIPLQRSHEGITAASGAAGACITGALLFWLFESVSMSVIGGVCLIAGPWLQLALGNAMPGSGAVALALTLVPVVVAVAEPALDGGEFSPTRLWPGLAAAAGLMVVAPLPGLSDWRADVVLLLMPVVVGIGCVLAKRPARGQRDQSLSLWVSAVLFAGMSVVSALVWKQHISVSMVAVGISALTFLLLSIAIRSISATQYASQYAVVPLLALLQAPLAISADVLSVRFVIGIALLGVACVAMLRDRAEEKET